MSETRWAALLRGVNVGGRNKLMMSDLRELLEGLGYRRVVTFIQSGNVALDAVDVSGVELARDISVAIENRFGLRVPVVVRSHGELVAVVADNPMAEHVEQPDKLLVGFAGASIDPAALTPVAGSIDQIAVAGRELYLFCPNGQGRAKLPNFDRQLGQPVTMRNWNTVVRLLSMTALPLLE